MRVGFPGGDGTVYRGTSSSASTSNTTPAMALMTPMAAGSRLAHNGRQRAESDEENLKEECSSTESTHQEVRRRRRRRSTPGDGRWVRVGGGPFCGGRGFCTGVRIFFFWVILSISEKN